MPVVDHPDLLPTSPGALQAATIFWTKRNINALADKNDVTGVCKAVNGCTNGLADQKTRLAKAAKIWPDGAVVDLGAVTVNVASDKPQPPQLAPPVINQSPSIPTASEPIPSRPDIATAPAAPSKKTAAAASMMAASRRRRSTIRARSGATTTSRSDLAQRCSPP